MPFAKGQSGNPKGRPVGAIKWATFSSVLKAELLKEGRGGEVNKEMLCRELVKIALNGESEAVRLKAIEMIVNRIDGTPRQSVEVKADIRQVTFTGNIDDELERRGYKKASSQLDSLVIEQEDEEDDAGN